MPPGRWSRCRILPPAGTAMLAVLAACARNYPQTSLAPKSEFARMLDDVFMHTVWWGLAVFVLVEGLILFTVLRFRQRREGSEAPPAHVHGHTRLEVAWTVAPAIILAFIAVPTIRTILVTQDDTPKPGDVKVRVVGHQWWWEFQYPDLKVVTANELHLPAGKRATFDLETADVLHSFWVPELAGKRDVIPGHVNHIWFTPDQPGAYTGQCAELCGYSHARMGFRVIVDSPEDFQAWVENERKPAVASAPPSAQTMTSAPADTLSWKGGVVGDAAQGAALFQRSACVACHTIDGTPSKGKVGPNLTHVGSRQRIAAERLPNDPESMALWLHDPPALKPGALMPNLNLKPEQIADLVAYLESLK